MRLDPAAFAAAYAAARAGKATGHGAQERAAPSRLRYDYLALSTLAADVERLLATLVSAPGGADPRALDLGTAASPYRGRLESLGFAVETLDVEPAKGVDHVGRIDRTGLPAARFDLVLCTQVLEHVPDPLAGLGEIGRILKPGGHVLFTVPHVWFYHPHPADYWRFTQEGVVELCHRTGFEVVELHAQGGSVLTLFQAISFLTYGLCGTWGAPLYLAVNWLAPILDRLLPNDLFCHNFACLAKLPS